MGADERPPQDRQEHARLDQRGETVGVGDVPDGGPAVGNLRQILDGTAADSRRAAFADAWRRRVRVVLSDDSLFAVGTV